MSFAAARHVDTKVGIQVGHALLEHGDHDGIFGLLQWHHTYHRAEVIVEVGDVDPS